MLLVSFLLAWMAVGQAEEPSRRLKVLPLPTLDISPETGLAGGAVVLFTGRPWAQTRPTTVGLEATVTTRRQLIFETDWTVFTPQDRILITGSLGLLRFPEDFWGIGTAAPDRAKERYTADRIEVDLAVMARVRPSLYIGPLWQLHGMFRVRPTDGGLLDSGSIPGSAGGVASGLGATVVWDSRERPLTPAAGESYGSIRQLWFTPETGSQFRFMRHAVDGRLYLGVGPTLLALQGTAQLHGGTPPFRMLALLGGDTATRGYVLGRYRDTHLLAAQAELRFPIVWRLGGVGFVGAGEVVPTLGALSVQGIRPSAGGGLRLRLDDEGTNLRVDVAAGIRSFGVYFGFGEAF